MLSKSVSVTDDPYSNWTRSEGADEDNIESLYDKEGNPKTEDLQIEDGEEVVKRLEVLKSEILLTVLEMKKENACHQKC